MISQVVDRVRSLDPIPWVVGAGATVIYLLRGFGGELSRDLAIYMYAGQRVAGGSLPYVDVFERGGPLSQLLPGIGVWGGRAVGVDDVIAVRWLFLSFAVATIILTYLLARDLFESRVAGVVAGAVMLSFSPFAYFAANGPRDKTALVMFIVAALFSMVRKRWAIAGFFVGLAALTWQPAVLPTMAALAVAILLGVDHGERLRAALRVVIGGSIPALVTVLAYVIAGEFGTFLDSFLLVNLTYTARQPFMTDPSRSINKIVTWYGVSLWLLVTGLVVMLGLAGLRLIRGRQRSPEVVSAAFMGLVTYLVFIIGWTWYDFDHFPDTYIFMPCGAVGVAALVVLLSKRRWIGLGAAAAVTAFGITLALAYAIGTPAEGLDEQRAAVTAVLDAIPGDVEIQSVEAPHPLVLSNQQNPVRFQLFGSNAIVYVGDIWPGGVDGFVDSIEDRSPTLIAVGRGVVPLWLEPMIDRSYTRAGSAPGWAWYLSNDAGEEQLRAVRTTIVETRQRFEGD